MVANHQNCLNVTTFPPISHKTSTVIAKGIKASGDRFVPRLVAYTDWISVSIIPWNLYTTNMCPARIKLGKHEDLHAGYSRATVRYPTPRALSLGLPPVTPSHMIIHPQHPLLPWSGSSSVVINTWDRYPSEKTDSLGRGAGSCARG